MPYTYNPATFTLSGDHETIALDAVFRDLIANQPFDEGSIHHILAQFYTAMRYVPFFILATQEPTQPNHTYRMVGHLALTSTGAAFLTNDAFTHALLAYLHAKGISVTLTS